jgi:hypothetical protein
MMVRMNDMGLVLVNGLGGRGGDFTRVDVDGGSVIDLIWVLEREVQRVEDMGVWIENDIGSDHFMVGMRMKRSDDERR